MAASIHWLIIGGYKVLPSLASIRSTLKGLPSSKAPIRPPEASVATTSQFISSFAQSYFLHSPCAHKSHSLRIFPGKPTYNRTSMKYSGPLNNIMYMYFLFLMIFLNNILFYLAYFIIRIKYIIHITYKSVLTIYVIGKASR